MQDGGITRRSLLKLAGGSALAAGCGSEDGAGLNIAESATFDEVLDQLHGTHPEHGQGLANHAPMAAEALVTLGREDRVARFVGRYPHRLRAFDAQPALAPGERGPALGDVARAAAWVATFDAELRDQDPREVLSRSWAVLAPGLSAAGFHGLIRAAHAVRSLGRADGASRRRELAHALGFWAARHWKLPGEPVARRERGLDVRMAFERMKKVDGFERQPRELIFQRMSWVNGNSDFVEAIETVDLDALPVGDAITELAAASARLLAVAGGIGYLHAVTGVSAFRLVSAWLPAEAARVGLGWVFQAVAAIHATYPSPRVIPASVPPSRRDVQALRASGGLSNDDHKIKLIEAALREHAIAPRPEFLAAADAW